MMVIHNPWIPVYPYWNYEYLKLARLVKEYAKASMRDTDFRLERFEAGCRELGI